MPRLPVFRVPRFSRISRVSMSRTRWIAVAVASVVVVGGTAGGVTLALRGGGSGSAGTRTALGTPALQPPAAGDSSSPTVAAPTGAPSPLASGALLPRTLQNEDLHAPYAAIPLQFAMPTIGVDVPMMGVGLTSKNAVDAPEGPASSSIWDQAFWYRGGAEPGQPGVFAVAGHVDRVGGGAAAFARLPQIKAGDVVSVTDKRTGAVYRYRITDARSYSLKEVSSLTVLDRIYGPDVDRGQPPHAPADGLARISIITCTGTWLGSQYDHRFVAFGDLIS
jgi:Sortase domain